MTSQTPREAHVSGRADDSRIARCECGAWRYYTRDQLADQLVARVLGHPNPIHCNHATPNLRRNA